MQKVYRLLRNNQETGPFTLEEILLLNLKPFDLVWLEGRSAAWRYPSEIEALKPFVPPVPQPQSPFEPLATAAMEQEPGPIPAVKAEVPKKIFVSMPEHLQQPSQKREVPPTPPPVEKKHMTYAGLAEASGDSYSKETLQTNYSKDLGGVEEDYTNWIYNKKTKTKTKSSISKKDLSIAALVVVLIIGGYFIISRPSVVETLPEQSATPVKTIEQPVTLPTQPTSSEQDPVTGPPPVTHESQKKKIISPKTTPAVVQKNHQVQQTETQNKAEVKTESTEPDGVATTEIKQPVSVPEQGKEKKKKFGEVVKGIFNKKDKKEDQKQGTVLEEPKPAIDRQSTKRNTTTEAGNEINNETLVNSIDITSNAPDNWMMGVSGLKLTIRNRNNVVLQTAAVQVSYFDENDQLLDRKSVYFNNVPAKGKSTMAAPDHKFADHVEFKLLAASAKEDHYASN